MISEENRSGRCDKGPEMRRTAALVLLILNACRQGAQDHRSAFTTTDSAGVEIREYAPPKPWTAPVALHEMARIGTVDGPPETLFSGIPGGRILSDGRLMLVDMASSEVRIFTRDGVFLESHGGKGQGPGEYEYIVGVGQCAPVGFTVFDIGWKMSFYDSSGDFVREDVTRLEQGSTPYYLACDTTGRVAVVNWDLSSKGPRIGFHTAMARLEILAKGQDPVDLGERIGSERFGLPGGSGPHPAGRSTRFGFAGPDLIVSDGSFFGYERWDSTGRLVEIVRVAGVPPPNTDSLMAAYLDAALAQAPNDEVRVRWRKQVADMGKPARSSFFSDLSVSGDWILLKGLSVGSTGRWFAFDRDGAPLGYLPLPERAQLLDERDGKLLIATRDSLDVVSAVLYSVDGMGSSKD